MKCTSCKSGVLLHGYIDGLIPCYICSECAGNLLMLSDYLRWMEANQNPEFISNNDASISADETSKAMLCPKTGTLMTKYRISKETEHRLDLSPKINAIWMDKGEWALLKEQGLAARLNEIFTNHWQRDIKSAESKDILNALYQVRFGEDYDLIESFRVRLNEMKNRSDVIAYLLADDPYKP